MKSFLTSLILKKQIADIFTKPLNNDRFLFLRRELGLCNPPKQI